LLATVGVDRCRAANRSASRIAASQPGYRPKSSETSSSKSGTAAIANSIIAREASAQPQGGISFRALRPERDNIAAPDLPEGIEWIGEPPHSMPVATAGGPVLVHFFDFAQLNSVRTLPYLAEWARRYEPDGLTMIGVQAPRFPFGAEREVVANGLAELGIEFAIAIDADRRLWHAYGCGGWPSLFLWKLGGALSWFHFGEGEYRATEEAIQAELREQDALRALPEPMDALRPSDEPGAKVVPPTPELFPGGSWETPWEGEKLEVPYEAGGAYVTIEGKGQLAIELDGSALDPIEISDTGLYKLVEHPKHERHKLQIGPSQGLRIWSIGFAAGVPLGERGTPRTGGYSKRRAN